MGTALVLPRRVFPVTRRGIEAPVIGEAGKSEFGREAVPLCVFTPLVRLGGAVSRGLSTARRYASMFATQSSMMRTLLENARFAEGIGGCQTKSAGRPGGPECAMVEVSLEPGSCQRIKRRQCSECQAR
jgi:hypothetical protein